MTAEILYIGVIDDIDEIEQTYWLYIKIVYHVELYLLLDENDEHDAHVMYIPFVNQNVVFIELNELIEL